MTRQDLRLWYRQDNGKDIPDLGVPTTHTNIDCANQEIIEIIEVVDDVNEYVEWLEEGLMAAKEIAQNLQSEIITIKSMNK